MKEASAALEGVADSPALRRAKAALREGEALLVERQKLIKIADRSASGWSLADDSDDEKRPEKAEKAAERKAGLKRKRRQQPLKGPRGQSQYPGPQVYGGYTANPPPPPPFFHCSSSSSPVAVARLDAGQEGCLPQCREGLWGLALPAETWGISGPTVRGRRPRRKSGILILLRCHVKAHRLMCMAAQL